MQQFHMCLPVTTKEELSPSRVARNRWQDSSQMVLTLIPFILACIQYKYVNNGGVELQADIYINM